MDLTEQLDDENDHAVAAVSLIFDEVKVEEE